MKKLRIAILGPLKRPILPGTTVSRNRVIVDLASGLIKKGHQLTIFATADSSLPGAKIVSVAPQGLNFLPAPENPFYQQTAYLTLMIKKALDIQNEFDIIHNHMYPEYLLLPALTSFSKPVVTTVHSQMVGETVQVLQSFPDAHLVAISQMAKRLSEMPSMDVVHNAVDTELFTPVDGPKDYLLFVGRMSKAKNSDGTFMDPKGLQNAIKIAELTGEHLKIVGNVEDPEFYEKLVKPHLSDKIEFVGEVTAEQTLTREQMASLFKGAKAFINPINWQEPFGLVMAEALACGTPVVAYDRGAVSEIVLDGKVGFVVDPNRGVGGFADAVKNINHIVRDNCRKHAVEHFSTRRMVDDYEKLYFNIIESR